VYELFAALCVAAGRIDWGRLEEEGVVKWSLPCARRL